MTCAALTSSTVVTKYPSEVLNVSMDFSTWLDTGVTISSKTVAADTGITVSSGSIDGQTVVFTVSGGTAGVTYWIIVTIVTSESETLVGQGRLQVVRSH